MATIEESKAAQYLNSPALMNDISVRKYLTQLTDAHEYAIMYAVLSEIPTRFRSNVVYFAADGNIYASRPSLRANASRFFEPSSPLTPGCNDSGAVGSTYCRGIFIRHYSKSNTQLTQAAVTTSTPCASTTLSPGNTNGYVLLGANIFDTPSTPNVATYYIDAGLQFSGTSGATIQNFMAVAGTSGTSGGTFPSHGSFVCAQNLTITFSEPSSTMLLLDVNGILRGQSQPQDYTTTFSANSGPIWGPSCLPAPQMPNCQVKRETSIAKADTYTFPDSVNSYFGVTHPGTINSLPAIVETNAQEGTQGGPLQTWTETEYDECPLAQGSIPAVLSSMNDQANETDGLQSQGISPPSNACLIATPAP